MALDRSILFLAVALIVCGGSLAVQAQLPGGMNEVTRTGLGGSTFVVGTVFLPSGRPVNYRMAVRLTSRAAGDILSSTDDRGQFIFSGVTEGQYTIVIDSERDFEPVAQPVDVPPVVRGGGRQTVTYTIRLSDRRRSDPKPGVVSTGDASASKRAVGLYKDALEKSKANDHKGAIDDLKQAVSDSPKYISAINELGAQYLVTGDLVKAEETLRSALAIDANALDPLGNLGICLFRLKRFADAEATLRKALTVNNRFAIAHFYLGRTLMALNRGDEAIKELTDTLSISGDEFKESHRLLAVLYLDKGDHQKVVDELETYLRLVPTAKDADELRLIIQQNRGAARPKDQ